MDNQNIAVLNVAAKFDEQSVKKVAKQFNKSMDSIESEFSGLSAQLNPEIVKKFDQALDKVNDKFKKINLSKYTTNVLKDLMDDAKGIEQKSASIQDFINKINALNEAVKGKKVKIFETFEPKQLEELFEFYDKIDKKQSDLIKKQEEFEKKAQSKIDSARSSKGLMQAYGSDIKNSNYQERINEIKSELSLSEKLTVQQEKTVEKYSKLLVLFDKMEQSKPAEGTIEAVKHSQELLNVVKEIREIEKTIGTFSKDKNFDSSKYTSSLSKVSGKEYYSDIEKMSEYSILQTVNNYKNTATAVIKDSISEIKINIEEYLKKTIELNRDAIVKAAEDAVEEIDEKIEKVSSKIKKDDSSKTKNTGTKKELTEEDITLYNKYFKISSLNAEELESEIKDVYDQLEKLYNKYSDNPDGILPEADRADFVGYYKQYIDLAKKIGDYDIDPDFSEAYDIFLRSNKTSNFANKLDEIKELVEAQKELKKSTDDLNESGASGGQNSGDDNFEEKSDNVKELEDSVQKLQEELEELKDRLVILENDNSFDSISTQVKELSDTFDKVNGKIEDLHSSINSIKDEKLDLRNIVFTAGDLDTPERLARKSDSFSQMIEAAIGNFGAFGSGKYVTRDVEDVASYGDDGRSYYAIDLSKYKNLLRFDSDEQIEDTIDFLLYLQKYLISITTSFRGFDNEISDFNVEKLEQEYHDVFNHLGLSIDQLKDFIKEITSQFSNLPVDDMNRINFDSQEYRSKDSYTTMLLKKLGYQGVDVSGSDEWDNVYQGSVIFDIDQLEPYVRKFKDAGEMIEFFDKKYEELESRKSKPPISDEVLSNIDALNEKLQKSLELYEKLEGRLQHIEKNLSKDISMQEPEATPTFFEDSSEQLSFVEQTEKAVDLIEEESGQMAMFENIAEKATGSAIEGQKTLNDYLDKNIEGQMTLNDLMDKQDDHREVGQTEILLGADKPVQEAEQYKQVSKDTVSMLSDIGLSYDELEEINKQEISSNEEVIASEEKKRKYKVAAKNEIPKLAKQESSAVIDANTDVVESNEEVIESEEKVRKYRVANRNDVPKLKSKSDISDSQDISDISDVSEDISKIDALKKKIEELGFSAKETEAILKSIDDGSLFRIDWSNDDEYKKIQKLLSYLKEYGYLVKNVKEDTDAFSYVGNITTPEKEKEIQETSKAYKDLTKDVKKYFELKNKEVKNNLTETDRKKLAELEAEIKDATTAQNKYANATGEAAEAQKKFNAEVEKYKDNSGQNYIADVSKKLKSIEGADGKTKAYLDQIAIIKAKIEELDKILPIDLTNQVEIDQLKKAQAEINKMMDSLSDKKFNSAVSQADTWTTRISQFLKQNSAAPKELLGQVENVQKRIVQLRNSVEGINEIQLKELTDEFKNLQAQITATGKTGISFGNKIVRKLKDLGAYLLTYVSFQDTIQVLRQGYEYVKEIDKQMIELEKVSDMSDARLAQSFDNSIESAKDLGSTISDVISATADWSRLGYNADAAEELAEVATIYKNVGDGIDISAANESLISTLQGFQMDASEAMKIVDAFNEVANRMPIDTAGIGEALQRSAASFNAANTTLNESIALITATNSVIQDPTRVGNMWKTVSARIRGAVTELEDAGLETEGMVESTSQLRDLIKSMTGFDIMIDSDTYKSMKDIIIGIGKEWDNLKDVDQAALLEKLAGKTQANALAAALDNYEMIEESFEIAQESAGSAMKEQEKWEEGLEARTNKLKASLEELAAVALDSDFLGGAIDAGRILIEVLTNIIDKAGALPTLLTTIGSVFGLYRSIKGDGRSKMFDLIMNMPSAMIPLMDT